MRFGVQLLNLLPPRPRGVVTIIIMGLAAGLAAVAFHLAIQALFSVGIASAARLDASRFALTSLIIVVGTAALAGWMLQRLAPEAAGSGVPQVKASFWRDSGAIGWRTTVVKFVAGTLTVGGGSSLGREGPSVHLAAGTASALAPWLGLPAHHRRTAAAAGAAAGLAAAFNTPLAAVTFVLEEIVGDLNSRLIGAILLASVMGAVVAHALIGSHPAFALPVVPKASSTVYALTLPVAAAAAVVGAIFQRGTLGLRAACRRWALPGWAKVAAGALGCWICAMLAFHLCGRLGVLGLGYEDLTAALRGDLALRTCVILLAAKLVATMLAYGSGGAGGIFAPLLFLGSLTGVVIGLAAGLAMPVGNPEILALGVVGMCACLGSVIGAPMTGIIIVFEMTREISLIPALLLATPVALLVGKRLLRSNFYDAVLRQDGVEVERLSPPRNLEDWMGLPAAHIANFKPRFAEGSEEAGLAKALQTHAHERLPVLDAAGKLIGVLERRTALPALARGLPPPLTEPATCLPDTPLGEVQRRLIESPAHLCVVMDKEGPQARPIGILTLHDLLRAEQRLGKGNAELTL